MRLELTMDEFKTLCAEKGIHVHMIMTDGKVYLSTPFPMSFMPPTPAPTPIMTAKDIMLKDHPLMQSVLTPHTKISAIKICRELTGKGLKESKDAVEAVLEIMEKEKKEKQP